MSLDDGIAVFKSNTDPKTIADWLGNMTIWVDPETFRRLPIWAPFTARKAPLFKADWVDRQTNRGQPKVEGNVAASKALTASLGLSNSTRKNWSCCHIWGNDDDTYQSGEAEVNDPRYFSCLSNMVLVPSPLKTFTDTIPEIKNALRIVAAERYGFCPEGRSVPKRGDCDDFFPKSWVQTNDIRTMPLSDKIRKAQDRQVNSLKSLHGNAGSQYPRRQVEDVIGYWNQKQPGSLLEGVLA